MAEKIRVLLSEEEVNRRITEIGEQISKEFEGEDVHLICVLRGSTFFTCELAKRITVPVTIDFMQVSSYGSQTLSSGKIKMVKELDDSIMGKNVIVIEDIIDTGRTLNDVVKMLKARNPLSLSVVTLLDKPSRRKVEFTPDYVGKVIPDKFVFGYGLDLFEKYRDLPFVAVVNPDYIK